MLVRFRLDRQILRHEADLHIRTDTMFQVGVEDPIEDGPIVDRVALGVFAVDPGRTPFQTGASVAGIEQVVRAEVDLLGRQRAKFADQFSAVLHRGIVWFIRPEESPDRLPWTKRRGSIDADLNSKHFLRR